MFHCLVLIDEEKFVHTNPINKVIIITDPKYLNQLKRTVYKLLENNFYPKKLMKITQKIETKVFNKTLINKNHNDTLNDTKVWYDRLLPL